MILFHFGKLARTFLLHTESTNWQKFDNNFLIMDHFHNEINSFRILPGTSLALISCGSKSQKRALLSATGEILLSVYLQHDMM